MRTKCKPLKIELYGTDSDIDRLAELIKNNRAVLRVNIADLLESETKTEAPLLASERSLARLRTYPGFGEEHTNAEWARRLGVPRNTLWRNLEKGLTVEQIAERRGIKYPAE